MIFCSVIDPEQKMPVDGLLLAESIRAFGGAFANNPIWFCLPDYGKPLSNHTSQRLKDLDVRIIPFPYNKDSSEIFFAAQLTGLEWMEGIAEDETELLVWMDANTLLLNQPNEFMLPDEKTFGYRPVHHLLLGSRFDQPLDAFWTQIYQDCQVPGERVFPMQPVVEDVQMRPYFNAGFMVLRPERRLVRHWHDTFNKLHPAPVYQNFYRQDFRYSIFMHQAVLAGVVLRLIETEKMMELPHTYNYPIHLFEQDQTSIRPSSIDDLITIRHEGFYLETDWKEKIPAGAKIKNWLVKKVDEIPFNQN